MSALGGRIDGMLRHRRHAELLLEVDAARADLGIADGDADDALWRSAPGALSVEAGLIKAREARDVLAQISKGRAANRLDVLVAALAEATEKGVHTVEVAELKLHVRGALNNGMTREEVGEAVLQAGIYCGVPAALDSMRVVVETFKSIDEESSEG